MPLFYTGLQLILLIILSLYTLVMIYAVFLGVPPIPTPAHVRRRVQEIIAAQVGAAAGLRMAELGAGYGDMAFLLARRFPAASVTAYERSAVVWWILALRTRLRRLANLVIRQQNFFQQPLGQFDVIFCYLGPSFMPKLQQQLLTEWRARPDMAPGEVLIISYTAPIPDWPLAEQHKLRGFFLPAALYVYKIRPEAFI